MFLKRISVFICPLLIFFGLELLFYNLKTIYYLPILLSALLLFFLKFLIKEKIYSRDFIYLSILPFLLFYSTLGFLFLLGSDIFRHVVIVILTLILIIYLENIFSFFHRPALYQPFSLENLTALLNLLIFFLATIDLNALATFLNLPIWLLSIILIAVTSLLLYQMFWINKIKAGRKTIFLLIINIVILESFWAFAFLPASFYVSSIILTIIYYLLSGLFKAKLSAKLDKKNILWYLIISLILLLIIIITSSWT